MSGAYKFWGFYGAALHFIILLLQHCNFAWPNGQIRVCTYL